MIDTTPLSPTQIEALETLCQQILVHPGNNGMEVMASEIDPRAKADYNKQMKLFQVVCGPDKVLSLIHMLKNRNRPSLDMKTKNWSIKQ